MSNRVDYYSPFGQHKSRNRQPENVSQSNIYLSPDLRSINYEQGRAVYGLHKQFSSIEKSVDNPYFRIARAVTVVVLAILASIGFGVANIATLGFVSVALIGALAIYEIAKSVKAALYKESLEEDVFQPAYDQKLGEVVIATQPEMLALQPRRREQRSSSFDPSAPVQQTQSFQSSRLA